jgi:hypothetical protein
MVVDAPVAARYRAVMGFAARAAQAVMFREGDACASRRAGSGRRRQAEIHGDREAWLAGPSSGGLHRMVNRWRTRDRCTECMVYCSPRGSRPHACNATASALLGCSLASAL